MADTTGTGLAAPAEPSASEQTLRWQGLLRCTCGHLGICEQDTERILEEQALQVGGIDLALHLNTPVQRGEFYADCGQPQAWQLADISQLLLQEALSSDMPGITIGLHPQSQHLVARSWLPLQAADDEGWLCTAMLLATANRALDVRQRFTLMTDGHR